jgi:hypothetical protein
MFSKSLTKRLTDFGSGFTDLRAKLDADMLLDFVIHRKREVKKYSCKNNVCSQRGVTW